MRRLFVVLFGAIVMALAVFQFWSPPTFTTEAGAPGTLATSPVDRVWYRVTSEQPGAVLRRGDLVALGRLSYLQRWRLSSAPYGYRVPVVVNRGGRELTAELTARFPRKTPVNWTELLTDFVWIGLAILIAARKPTAMTASFLAFTAYLLDSVALPRSFGFLSDAAFTVVVYVLPPLILTFPNLFLAAFAVRFPSGLNSQWRRYLSLAIYVAMAGVLLSDAIRLPLLVSLTGNPVAPIETWFTALAVFAIAIASYVQASAAERPRIGIVLVGLAVTIVANAIAESMLEFSRGTTSALYDTVYVMGAALPISVAYAVLRYRVIDLGFALNRTAAYGLTSLLLIGLFAGLEWGAARFIAASNHIENALIDLAITLIVVFSFRFVHVRVDQAVDNVLFRKRHDDEAALHRFERNAHFYTDASALLRDALTVIQRRCELSAAALYLHSPSGYVAAVSSFKDQTPIDANDGALVDVRAHRAVLDLADLHTAVPGVRLYPMLVAAELTGFLTIGERTGFEEMPADIDRALTALVASLAHSLHALKHAEKEAEIARLRDQLAALSLKEIGAQFG